MTQKVPFSYCLLQYEHDPWLKERLNIGVLMFSDKENYIKLKSRGWEGRLFAAYPSMQRPSYSEDMKQIERVFYRYSKSEFIQPSLLDLGYGSHNYPLQPKHLALQLAKKLAPDADSSYRWIKGGSGLCHSLDDKIEELFSRFVIGFDKPKTTQARSDEQVWAGVSKKLLERKLSKFIEYDPSVATELGNIKFHAGYKNGSLHVIQPLSLDLKDDDNISSKVAKWAGYVQAVKDMPASKIQTHFVLGFPTEAGLMNSFERASNYLRKVSGQENVVTENETDSFVDEIAVRLKDH